ncbi:MAG: phospho-N-acetylmuramoyl-pentapeptide-transferase [Cytophagales bacterium]|nr:MAG: phospho-N-acetylmuramoyl-pentapeptide-transferase [Cytophagales bacterium]TAF61148.1 MAG: phospho-N-acetylmuramoyl-pentapeptide-transferase [Cytophagales bacterium]
MLYYLFKYLRSIIDFPGAGLFQYISFRALAAAILSVLISILFGKRMIRFLQYKQIGETIRNLGLQGENLKAGTPTMGGLIIIASIFIPTLLFAQITNIYIILLLISLIWMGLIGFMDDYIKIFRKNKAGLKGRFKIVGQIGLGLLVGITMYLHESIVIREFITDLDSINLREAISQASLQFQDIKSLKTTIPFFKNNELDYSQLLPFFEGKLSAIFYILIVTFIITAVSNGSNITDGLDGLATGVSAIIGAVLGILAYVSGNIVFSDYLNIMYLPHTSEIVIFCLAFVGACVGFLWYNSFPAQVFMGDTGSLSLGAVIAVLSIILRKELLIPVLCGVFLVENLSVMLQVSYFKYTKKKYGEGRRIFRMSPLHHHYQKGGMHESKIVMRFWMCSLLLAMLTLATLKIR